MKRLLRRVLLARFLATRHTAIAVAGMLAVGSLPAVADGQDGPVRIDSVLLKVIEETEVAAGKEGVIAKIHVREGAAVNEGDPLAQLDDDEARLAAEKSRIEAEIAARRAGNDVNVRFARKSLAVAQAELRRARESAERYAASVSKSELDRLQLVAERAELEVEQAEHEASIAALTAKIKQNELQRATEEVDERRITAPAAGVVVSVARSAGEWVKPGDPVVRLVRIDRLRAEGFLNAQYATQDLTGTPVRLLVEQGGRRIERPGTVVFLSPEIDPVNGQVRVWAEIDNAAIDLRAGMRGTLEFEPSDAEVKQPTQK